MFFSVLSRAISRDLVQVICGLSPRLLLQEALAMIAERRKVLLLLFFFCDLVLTDMSLFLFCDLLLTDMSLFFFCDLMLTKLCGGRYHQAGTPKLEVSTSYDSSAHTYTIRTKQSTPTSSNAAMQPVMLPLAVALFDKNGHEMSLKLKVSMTGTLSLWCLVDCMKLITPTSTSSTSILVLLLVLFCLVFPVCLSIHASSIVHCMHVV